MNHKKKTNTGLSKKDMLMFSTFMEWHNKSKGTFYYNDPGFQLFKSMNNIELDKDSLIPNKIEKPNTIVYKIRNSGVGDLARHIKNAYSHSRIRKEKGYFVMTDFNPQTKETTMRGKISVKMMPALLNAIRDNKRDRGKKMK